MASSEVENAVIYSSGHGAAAPSAPPRRRRPQATGLRDVAAQAGVGIATASAVLNGSRSNTRVSPATRERVLAVAKELDYHPNALARGLSGRPTKTLGVLFGLERASVAVANPYAFTIFQGIVAGAADAGYNVTLFTDPWHNAEQSGGILRDRSTDGVLLIAVTTGSDVLASVTASGVPAVTVSSSSGSYDIPSVDVDNELGARLATEHLIGLGHCRIAHLSGDEDLVNAAERRDAFLRTMADAGLPVAPEHLPPGSYETASGYGRTRRLLALPAPPTAIFAGNDSLALAALQAARDAGIDVPGQLSVIGFDDIPTLALGYPGLTTIHQPLPEIGKAGAEMLIALVEDGHVLQKQRLFAPDLVVRDSTAPPE